MKVHLMSADLARHLTPNPSCQIISFGGSLKREHVVTLSLPELGTWSEGVDWTHLVQALKQARDRNISDLVLVGDHAASAHIMAAITAAGLGTAYTWDTSPVTGIAPTKALAALKIRLTLEIA